VGADDETVYIAAVTKARLTLYIVRDEIVKEKTSLSLSQHTR